MSTESKYLHEIVITVIIIKDGKYLITKRSPDKKRFPSMWTVPGGRLEADDYLQLPKDTEFYRYNVLERTLRREVQEEVGIEIDNIEYVTSLATVHDDGSPSMVIACVADYTSGEVTLSDEDESFEWVTLEEAKGYDLIDGIQEELAMAENQRSGTKSEWKRDK
ncbi:MAG: NUDIX domain-containing protein [Candidatus Pacebacteria bacterium]|nr:NUDIX domain-containing protein [Candidatus Paceibacterota bacterium]